MKTTTPKIGDVVTTNNYRLGMKIKKGKSNGRMAVVTPKGKDKALNPIVTIRDNNRKSKNMIPIDKDKNKFLKNKSAVLNKQVDSINSTPKEIKQGKAKKQPVNLNNKNFFGKVVGKLHWKDKKKVLKNINK